MDKPAVKPGDIVVLGNSGMVGTMFVGFKAEVLSGINSEGKVFLRPLEDRPDTGERSDFYWKSDYTLVNPAVKAGDIIVLTEVIQGNAGWADFKAQVVSVDLTGHPYCRPLSSRPDGHRFANFSWGFGYRLENDDSKQRAIDNLMAAVDSLRNLGIKVEASYDIETKTIERIIL